MAACGASSTSEPSASPATEPSSTNDGAEPAAAALDWQGHRGARGLRPENTLPGFELALDLGVDTLELDLHLSADDQAVVWHDPIVDGSKCQGDGVSTRVRDLTSAELRSLDCRLNPDQGRFPEQEPAPGDLAGDDYGIVTLSELFDFVAGYAQSADKAEELRQNAATVRFNVETKRRPDDPAAIDDGFDGERPGVFEQAVVAAVIEAGLADRVSVQSFDHRSLWAVRSENPELALVALTRRGDQPDFADLAGRGASVWSPDHRSLTVELVEAAHATGLEVIPWTVNDPLEMDRLIGLGIDGIITDRPDLRP